MTEKPDCEIICPDCKTLITIDKCGVLSEALKAEREKLYKTLESKCVEYHGAPLVHFSSIEDIFLRSKL